MSVEQYLRTSYHPDCDFVDGHVLERNWREKTHARTHANLILYLARRSKELGIEVFPGVRLQVAPTRIRIPDLAVFKAPSPDEEVFTSPPSLCVEVLSPRDSAVYMLDKFDDYLSFGVLFVWLIDPWEERAFVVTQAGMVEAKSGFLGTKDPDIRVPLTELFVE